MEICTAFVPAVLAQYAEIVQQNEKSESVIFLGKLMTAMLDALNASSHQSAPSLHAWFDHAIRHFDLATVDQLGFDESMTHSVIDNAMERMETAAKSNSVFVRQDLDAIIREVSSSNTTTSSRN